MRFKDANDLMIGNKSVVNGEYKKPISCPYCDNYIEPVPVEHARMSYEMNSTILMISYRCPACDKKFICIYKMNDSNADYLSVVPIANEQKLPEGLEKISPRFESVHQQAFRAEARGDIEISIVGYRTALEILLKDYAIGVLHAPESEVIGKGLRKTIDDYAPEEIISATDVVRIIGDDYTHYVNGHPDVEFDEFKGYYDMILAYLEYIYKLKRPPVSR